MKKDVYRELKDHFINDNEVVVNTGKGAQGIKYQNKMFIMFYKGDLLIKLSSDRIQELVDSGEGEPFDPGTGKVMKDRILIPHSKKVTWLNLSKESRDFIIGNH